MSDPDGVKQQPLRVRFDELLAAERDGLRSGDVSEYCATAGFHVLHWLRVLDAHVYLPKTLLTDAGLSVGIVDAAVAAAVKAWANQGHPLTAAGALVMLLNPRRTRSFL